MRQASLAEQTGFQRYSKKTKRALFLEEMEQVVPWSELCSLVEPYYPKAGNGRRPVGIERMLRIYFLQQWFNLSDPSVEEALYDSPLMRHFAQIDLGNEPVPDETTVCSTSRPGSAVVAELCCRSFSVVLSCKTIGAFVFGKNTRGVRQYGNVLLQFCNPCAQRLDPTFLLLNFLEYCHRNPRER